MGRAFAADTSPIQDCCEGTGRRKVASIQMQYTAEDCSATNHGQTPSVVTCIDYAALPAVDSVYIVATDKVDYISGDGEPNESAVVWFEGTVAPNGTIDVDSATAGRTELKGETFIHIFALDGSDPDYANQLQKVGFHTSCSEPLTVGNQFGSARIIACAALAPATAVAAVVDTGNCCQDGEGIGSLNLEYRGLEPAVVVAADTDNYLTGNGEPKPSATIWFQDSLASGGSFGVTALPGETLGKSVWLHVSDPETAEVLETVLIPTSCDQPISVGDLFGTFALLACSGPTS